MLEDRFRNLKPFEQGHKKIGGRKKGVPNKLPGSVKKAIVDAATRIGLDGHGFAGLCGYMIRVAILSPVAFVRLLLTRLLLSELRQKTAVKHSLDFSRLTAEEVVTLANLVEKASPPSCEQAEDESSTIDMDLCYKKIRELEEQHQRASQPTRGKTARRMTSPSLTKPPV